MQIFPISTLSTMALNSPRTQKHTKYFHPPTTLVINIIVVCHLADLGFKGGASDISTNFHATTHRLPHVFSWARNFPFSTSTIFAGHGYNDGAPFRPQEPNIWRWSTGHETDIHWPIGCCKFESLRDKLS